MKPLLTPGAYVPTEGTVTPCQRDPEAWFSEAVENVAYTKQQCQTCPVRLACLKAAVDQDEEWGVWGGMSAEERNNARTKDPNRCRRGHLKLGDNLRIDANGWRLCVECERERCQRNRSRRRGDAA